MTKNKSVRGIFGFAVEQDVETPSDGPEGVSREVLADYLSQIDPKLLDIGWAFRSAKSVEYGKTDQPMVNHVRNGVFAIARLNEVVGELGGYEMGEQELREVVALVTIHDLHKRRGETDVDDEYDIEKSEVEALVSRLELDEFVDSLDMETFRACAVDHHDSWNANPEHSTRKYNRLRPYVKLADDFASCPTPEEAAAERNETGLHRAYPGMQLGLRYHSLDDVKGVFTNLLNGVVSDVLHDHYGHRLLAIYQEGCVYVVDEEAANEPPELDDEFVTKLYEGLENNVQESHETFQDRTALAENLATRSQGFYGINQQDVFYAGAGTVLAAIVTKAEQDADPDDSPTESMEETMEALSERLPIDIFAGDRVAPGYARLAYTVKRAFVDPIVDAGEAEDALVATCRVFDLPDDVTEGLLAIRDGDDLDLTSGGKWDYGYAIGQHVADRKREERWSGGDIAKWVKSGLEELAENWTDVAMDAHAGQFEGELRAYISDVVRVEGGSLPTTGDDVSDAFDEHHAQRRGKTCTFCNRGTTSSRKGDMEAPKSLTTFQAGYSNRIPADAGKPDNLLVCTPCKVEFSLRETGSARRDADRLFVHLVPDYFYTPHLWELYLTDVFQRFTGEARTRLGHLASAAFRLADADLTHHENLVVGDGDERGVEGYDYISATDLDWPEEADSFVEILQEAATGEGGRSMVEDLSQGFKPDAQYGTRTLSFYKPQDNETEFQFFGVFLGLAVATAAGLRVYVSESPLPDLHGRHFPEMARLDAGFSRVADFFGEEIPLSDLPRRLGAAAALVQLGYELRRDDAMFAKHLRVARNKPLPGSYLLKRIAQATDDGNTAQFLLEEARFLDENVGPEETVPDSDLAKME